MRRTAATGQQPIPWRPPHWPFRVTDRLGIWLRWTARIWLLAATTIFTVEAFFGAVPGGADHPFEVRIQLAIFGVVILGEIVATRWQAVGASIITIGAILLGVLAAIQYTPLHALVFTLTFFLPALLYWLDWQRQHTVRASVVLAASLAGVLVAGGIGAHQMYQSHHRAIGRMMVEMWGSSHPDSILSKLPVTTVEWIWSGAQSDTSVTVNARLAYNSDAVYLAVSRDSAMTDARLFGPATADRRANQRIVSITADGLTPDTDYYYAIQTERETDLAHMGQFRTFASGPFSFTFAVGTCAWTGSNAQVFDTIREWPRLLEPLRLVDEPAGVSVHGLAPLFYLQDGDLFYEDIGVNDPARFRAAYDKVLTAPAQAALYRAMPIVYLWDDHDFGPDGADRTAAGREASRQVYRQVVPHHALPAGESSGPIYRAFTVGRVRFILTDLRSERSPTSDPDNAEKTMLGPEQKAWFKQELLAAKDTASLIVWVSTVPWIGAARESADHWAGYATERTDLADFIAEHTITNLLMISGDAHMVAIDDGRNSDYATHGGARFPVFHAGALDQIGSDKGGPYSEGSFPGSGHFGLVTIQEGDATTTVTITGRDYRGRAIASHTFQVPAGSK